VSPSTTDDFKFKECTSYIVGGTFGGFRRLRSPRYARATPLNPLRLYRTPIRGLAIAGDTACMQVQRTNSKRKAISIKEDEMLRWALGFFIVALIAAVLGFTGIALAAAGIAKILFYLFLILFLVTMVSHLLRRT